MLVNKVNGVQKHETSFEELQIKNDEFMAAYKREVGNINLIGSDRKKILSLPIYAVKRNQKPTPKLCQSTFDLFTNITGKTFTSDLFLDIDKETKITEFDFEKYINPALLQRVETQNDKFKNFVKMNNFLTKTRYEQLQEDKKNFTNSTDILASLTPKEQRELVHLLNNERGRTAEGDEELED